MPPAPREPEFRVGCQTIIWGRTISNIPRALDFIAACGFQGVEFAQHPEVFKGWGYPRLRDEARSRGLTILGFAGGTLRERMAFLGDEREPYLYADEWNEAAITHAIGSGFRVALHPHAFKGLDHLDVAFKRLYDHPQLLWLPDTAHLAVVGQSFERAIRRFPERVAAIHFKDWTPVYGRLSQRYARGIRALGKGALPLEAMARFVLRQDWSRRTGGLDPRPWIVPEQDISEDRVRDLAEAAQWCNLHGFSIEPAAITEEWLESWQDQNGDAREEDVDPQRSRFLLALWKYARRGDSKFYSDAAKEMAEALGSPALAIWSHSPSDQLMTLVAHYPRDLQIPDEWRQGPDNSHLSRLAIERQRRTEFDLDAVRPGDVLAGESDLAVQRMTSLLLPEARRTGMTWLHVVPVFNTHNPHQVRLAVEFLSDAKELPPSLHPGRMAADLSSVSDSWLTDRCLTAASGASLALADMKTEADFCAGLARVAAERVDAEHSAVFLRGTSKNDDALYFKGAFGAFQWRVPKDQEFYERGEGLTGTVWKTLTPLISPNALDRDDRIRKSEEVGAREHEARLMILPLVAQDGAAQGVVRLRNRGGPTRESMPCFWDEDLAVVESIFQSVLSDLMELRQHEARDRWWRTLMHEVRRPLVGIRGVLGNLHSTLEASTRSQDQTAANVAKDALAWSELMARLLLTSGIGDETSREYRFERMDFATEIAGPILRQSLLSLREHKLREDLIQVEGLDLIPVLYLDRPSMQQVFFNVLDNAIKYSSGKAVSIAPAANQLTDETAVFHVHGVPRILIRAVVGAHKIQIQFKDWGIGVPEGWKERIFLQEVRAPNAIEGTAPGQGLGLHVVREILKRHGGTIEVTNLSGPTEFTITLRRGLEKRPPAIRQRRHREAVNNEDIRAGG